LTVLFTAQTVKAQDIEDDFDDFLSPLVGPTVNVTADPDISRSF